MGLGTKNRQKLIAELCREHLRSSHREQLGLVEEYIRELEGPEENSVPWSRFCDLKRDNREMLARLEEHFQSWLNP